jgi:hypothetical protein
MSFGSNGEDQVRSLRKISTQLRAQTKWSGTPKYMSFGYYGVDEVRSLRKNSDATFFSELVR